MISAIIVPLQSELLKVIWFVLKPIAGLQRKLAGEVSLGCMSIPKMDFTKIPPSGKV